MMQKQCEEAFRIVTSAPCGALARTENSRREQEGSHGLATETFQGPSLYREPAEPRHPTPADVPLCLTTWVSLQPLAQQGPTAGSPGTERDSRGKGPNSGVGRGEAGLGVAVQLLAFQQ